MGRIEREKKLVLISTISYAVEVSRVVIEGVIHTCEKFVLDEDGVIIRCNQKVDPTFVSNYLTLNDDFATYSSVCGGTITCTREKSIQH